MRNVDVMNPVSAIRIVRAKPKKLLPIIALTLAVSFIVTLHPASGGMGGFVFLLTGWFMPSAINLLLAGWIVLFLGAGWRIRSVMFVLVSFVLGVAIPLIGSITASVQSRLNSTVVRTIHITPATPLDAYLRPTSETPMNYVAAPDPLGVSVGGDEGCMCVYFANGGYDGRLKSYYQDIQDDIGKALGLHEDPQWYAPKKLTEKVHFYVGFRKSAVVNNAFDMTVNIYEGGERTATFSEYNMPISQLDASSLGRNRPLLNGHFYRYSASMLIRRNFWMYFL